MNIGVVTAICKAQGMNSVCLQSGCIHNSPGCRLTPLSTSCTREGPMTGLARKICNTRYVDQCPSMDGMFTDHLSSFLAAGTDVINGACGFVSSEPSWKWCTRGGANFVSSESKPLYAYCVL